MLPLLLALLAPAAEPSETWRTVETEHFRMHYPLPAEDWALQAAARLEAMRARVEEQVGMTLDRKVTIILRDPVADSNGMALPFTRRPRTELWVTPPGASSVIGWNRRWDEGLIVHEDTHLVHLAQPSRGGFDRVLDALSGVGPIARKSPRWVIEGYATVVEGDQTGFGRPFAATEAAVLRRLATEGRLPTYGELDGSGRWGGFGYAYGIGNAYLRWLRDRAGEDSLRHLWKRLTAKKGRTFDDAFEGVFGDSPEALYGRFTAEVTASAMALEGARPARDGTRFLDLERYTSAPDLTADGSKLVVVVSEDKKPVLAVWDTTPREDADKEWDKAVERLLANDPLDVPAVRSPEPSLKEPTVRHRRDRSPSEPRWLDEDTVLFGARAPDPSGRLRRDLFAWVPATGEEWRVTKLQDVHTADPVPDGTAAIAVKESWGKACLARVDIKSGSVDCLTEPRVDTIYDDPQVHPDGDRVLWLQQREGPWALWTAPLTADGLGEPTKIALPAHVQISGPRWHPDGTRIVFAAGLPQLQEIASYTLEDGSIELWTRSHGGATGPAIGGDFVYFRDEDANGLDLHRQAIPGTDGAPEADPLPEPLEGTPLGTVPEAPVVSLPAPVEVTPRPYGLGRQEGRPILSAQVTREEARLVGGVRLGDIVGRHETLLYAGTYTLKDRDRQFGVRSATAFRSLPVDLYLDTWFTQDPRSGDLRLGGNVALGDKARLPAAIGLFQVGGFADPGLDGAPARYAGHLTLAGVAWEPGNRWIDLGGQVSTTAGLIDTDELGALSSARVRLGVLRGALAGRARMDLALGGAPDLSLGGLGDTLVPDAWQADRIWQPALPLSVGTGRTHLELDAQLGNQDAGLFVTRHMIGDGIDLQRGTTLIGLRGDGALPAQRLAGVPKAVATLGLACRLEDPVSGVPDKPCRDLDHWTGWIGVRWRVD